MQMAIRAVYRFASVAVILGAQTVWGQDPAASAPAPSQATSTSLRTWRSVSGATIDAEFVKVQYGNVHLRTADGKPVVIGMARLTPEDRTAAEQLAAAAAPAEPEPPARKLASWQKAKAEEAARPPPPKELVDLFGDKLTDEKKKHLGAEALSGAEKIGIYFSAHWCGPCRAFTPKLVEAYKDLRRDKKAFEVVFVSADRDQDGMFGYMKELNMPWLAIPYDSKVRKALMQKYQVSGIPRLVIVSASGKVLSNNAVGEVGADGAKAYDRW